ncbi:MAG: Sec-dependent nitrous-oxide reductase [Planctomycetes bacterium]|jgi:nitrous-oxide reductase|nr:Sec-dependent nitrous-oxide reductase [Planctomycetota bacterium]
MQQKTRIRSPRIVAILTLSVFAACGGRQAANGGGGGAGGDVLALMNARGLSEQDVTAALKTYTPTGKHDEYYTFASGGHGGNLIVIGVPSMRILKYVGVFSPEPWQGYGYGDESGEVLRQGNRGGQTLTWADMHHPALSETAGDYDGKYIFVNDKCNPRVAVVDLSDFTTQQIVSSELIASEHGATFVTPDTDYVVETSQYPAPLGGVYAPIEQFDEKYRGAMIFWKFDKARGRIVPAESFAIELPPYMQDLADCGKKGSDGWVFCNSINTERAYGGILEGKPPLESGATQNDMDYLHCINWRGAEAIAKAGKTETIAGMRVIRMQTAIDEGLLAFVPEPKSPHGVDVTPDGTGIVVGGKLDTHTTLFDIQKIIAQMRAKQFVGKDPYGVPILDFKSSVFGQCEIGLGPLHTVFDDKGFAYTSVFIETVVAKWSLKDLVVVDKIDTHFNIGHLVSAEGDTVSPDGKYLIAMNKWALDRFAPVGPLLPQNFQLIDISGAKMQLLYDMPLPLGEPHNAQMIKAGKLKPIEVYKPIGTNPYTHDVDPSATVAGKERIERKADGVHVYMTAVRSHFSPDIVRVKQGDTVHLHVTSVEQAKDATHGLAIGGQNINVSLEPGKHCNIVFKVERAGVFPFYCTEFCSALHLEMAGYLLVEPK